MSNSSTSQNVPQCEFVTAEIFLMVDDEGNQVSHYDESFLSELWENEIGSVPMNCRTIRLVVNVPFPKPVLEVNFPQTDSKITVTASM